MTNDLLRLKVFRYLIRAGIGDILAVEQRLVIDVGRGCLRRASVARRCAAHLRTGGARRVAPMGVLRTAGVAVGAGDLVLDDRFDGVCQHELTAGTPAVDSLPYYCLNHH